MDEKVLLKIAKDSILEAFKETKIDKEHLLREYPELSEKKATFVTLTQHNNLRGCIGSLIAHRSLLEDTIHNAKAAAFSDPRFRPLDRKELEFTDIEISILSTPEEVVYSDIDDLRQKIAPFIDGVILKDGYFQATFLPQVWEQLPEFELFFAHLCLKAGLNQDCLKRHPQIFKYQVRKIRE